MRLYFILLFTIYISFANAQTEIKTMFYNLLNYPTAPPSNRNIILKNILNTYEPDLFLVCELESETASSSILNFSLSEINKNYQRAVFFPNQSDTSSDSSLQQLAFFNSDYFELDDQEILVTPVRDINHYTFVLKTHDYLTNPTYLEVFVTHLKSSSGTANQQLRLQMVNEFVSALEDLNENSFVLFAGDFNFYTSSELGYQKILNSNNNILIKDPLNLNNILQSWHNNDSWTSLHTQSTRLSNSGFGGFGAGGGLDDRFDFIMLSENLLGSDSIHYLTDSYQNYGNNSNCFDNRIDHVDCDGSFDSDLRDNLYLMSDHLPVVLSLETTQTLATTNNELLTQNLIQFKNGNVLNNDLDLILSEQLIHHKILIYNNLGQKIKTQKIESTQLNFDISLLTKGVYYLKVEGFNIPVKFIKK